MRACYHGKVDTAIYLYRWNSAAFKILNYDGESCFDLAAPHEGLVAELERLEKIRKLSEDKARDKDWAKMKPLVKSRSRGRIGNGGGLSQDFLKPGSFLRYLPEFPRENVSACPKNSKSQKVLVPGQVV